MATDARPAVLSMSCDRCPVAPSCCANRFMMWGLSVSDRVWIIAEAGVNHNGSIDRALQLVEVAADAGADVIKFQTFKAEKLATAKAAKADYQVINTNRRAATHNAAIA